MKTRFVILIGFLCIFFARNTQAADLTLRYDHPAPMTPAGWERQSLPIGNGRLGGSFFGGTGVERLLINEITLWTGSAYVHGSYQAVANLDIALPGHDTAVTDYRHELDLQTAVGSVTYKKDGITFRREFFASHPDHVLVIRLTADKPAAYSGQIKLTDLHNVPVTLAGNILTAAGKLPAAAPPPARNRRGTPPASAPSVPPRPRPRSNPKPR